MAALGAARAIMTNGAAGNNTGSAGWGRWEAGRCGILAPWGLNGRWYAHVARVLYVGSCDQYALHIITLRVLLDSNMLQRHTFTMRKIRDDESTWGTGHAAQSCARWPLGIRFQGNAPGRIEGWIWLWATEFCQSVRLPAKLWKIFSDKKFAWNL